MALLTKRRSRLTPIGLIFQALRDYARYKRLVKLYCIRFLTIVVLVQESFVTPSFNIKNILTQLLSALSRHTLRNQKNINDRIVISMTYSLWNVAHARAERFITFAIGRFNNEQKRLFTTP